MIELDGKVVSVISGSENHDGRRRVTVKVADADFAFNELRIPNCELQVDDIVRVEISSARKPTSFLISDSPIERVFPDATK
jgi:hypothetical protein